MTQSKPEFMVNSSVEPISARNNSIDRVRKVIASLENETRNAKQDKQNVSRTACKSPDVEDSLESNQVKIRSVGEIIVDELESLKDGWSGSESVVPAKIILKEAKELVKALKIQSRNNLKVWVDDDGTVTFYWRLKNRDILSIDLYGDGKAHCTFTPGNNEPSVLENFKFSENKLLNEFVYPRIN